MVIGQETKIHCAFRGNIILHKQSLFTFLLTS